MICQDCNTEIDNTRKRCQPCAKRHKHEYNVKRQRDKRHERGLKTSHAKGGKEELVDAECMRCNSHIKAAKNRKDSTLCIPCRTVSNRVKSLGQYHKRNPKPQTVSLGDVCGICRRPFVRGLCECKE